MKIHVKKQNKADKRVWDDLGIFTSRIEAVRAMGVPLSPSNIAKWKIGKWMAPRKDIHVKILEK